MEIGDVVYFETPTEFRAWFAAHAETAEELWVGYWKKASGVPSVTWEETVDEALCVGWIDGIRKSLDERSYTIRFTPRRSTSVWSRRNLDRYGALFAEGRIQEAGSSAFERGRAASHEVVTELSPEFLGRLRENPRAFNDWEARPAGYRRRASHWVMSAKRAHTRERRFLSLVEDHEAGQKIKLLR